MASQESIQELLDKYWAAETTPEEEQQLRAKITTEDQGVYSAYFRMLQEESARTMRTRMSPVRQTRHIRLKRVLSIAAAVLILVTAGVYVQQTMLDGSRMPKTADSYTADSYEDPMKAYEEAKEALLLVSAKLNKTREKAGEQLAKTQPYIEIIK